MGDRAVRVARWVLVGLTVQHVLEGLMVRLHRQRLQALPDPGTVPDDELTCHVDVVVVEGSQVDERTRAAVAAEMRATGAKVVDLVPGDLALERAYSFVRAVDPDRVRDDPLHTPFGAQHAVVLHRAVAEGMGLTGGETVDRHTLVRRTVNAKQHAPTSTVVRLAPHLRATPATAADRWREIEMWTDFAEPNFGLAPLWIGFELAHLAVLSAGWLFVPWAGLVALVTWSAQPVVAFAFVEASPSASSEGSATAWTPPALAFGSLLRLPRAWVEKLATAATAVRATRERRAEHTATWARATVTGAPEATGGAAGEVGAAAGRVAGAPEATGGAAGEVGAAAGAPEATGGAAGEVGAAARGSAAIGGTTRSGAARHVTPLAGDLFDRRRETCPWCGAHELVARLDTTDLLQFKPGEFHLDECDACGHIFQNPALSTKGLEYYYEQAYDGDNEHMAESIFGAMLTSYQGRIEAIARFHEPRAWLDVGAGYGHFCLMARQRWPEARFDGLDLSESVEEASRRGWLDTAYRGLFPEMADGLPRTYDVVSMHHYLEHTRDPHHELSAAVKVLDPGGYLMIEVPDAASPWSRRLGRFWGPWFQPQHLHFVTCDNLAVALRDLGMEVVSVERGPVTTGGDLSIAWLFALQRCAPLRERPWSPSLTPAQRAKRMAILAAGLPVLAVLVAVDNVRDALLRRPGNPKPSNAYRMVARRR